ncbi:MAG: DUF2384 domain-containing protein [Firmicutes bacterium]|nr:DUF2384 domain-containing protein [Bacillota bacterium]
MTKDERPQLNNQEAASQPATSTTLVYDFLRPKLERVAQDLHDALVDYAEKENFAAHLDAAFHVFFSEDALEILDPEEEAAFISFIEWFIYDYRLSPKGGRLIEHFFKEKKGTFGPLEQEMLQQWLDSTISLYEVYQVKEDGIGAEDLFTGERIWIADANISAGVTLWSVLLCRLLPVGDGFQPSGAALEVPPMFKYDILRQTQADFRHWQHRGRKGGWQAYLKDRGYLLNTTVARLFAAGQEELFAQEEELNRHDMALPRAVLGLSPETRDKLLRQYYEEYFRQWPDTPHPGLRGLTPRQYCQNPAGRRRVRELLKELEFIEERKKQAGEVHYDISCLRQALNLPPEEQSSERQAIKWLNPAHKKVAEELRKSLADAGYLKLQVDNAVQLWADFCRLAQPEVKKTQTWLAALEYTMARLELTAGVTQKELGHKYHVAAGTVSSNFRTIWRTLGLESFDQRYTTQEDPYSKLLRFLR